ncbi:MAG: hypothetical protein JWM43_2345 [Acidobacteriaceae bacterium]|nr:hypothetical protein [Acidobacteriaceae bacterium]
MRRTFTASYCASMNYTVALSVLLLHGNGEVQRRNRGTRCDRDGDRVGACGCGYDSEGFSRAAAIATAATGESHEGR